MTTKYKILLGLSALLTAFAAGRFTVPEKIKIETKTVEVEKKTDVTKTDTDRDRHRETTTTQVKRPDGTVETTTKLVEDDTTKRKTDSKQTQTDSITETASKEIVRGSSPVTISALGGIPLSFSSITPVFGAAVTKPLLGPIAIGLWGLSSREVGASLGLTF